MAIVLVLVVSLAANAALFVGGVLYNVIDEALENVTGLATATGKQRKQVNDLKRRNRHLIVRNRKLQDGMTKVRRTNRLLVVRNNKLQDGMTKIRRTNRLLVVRNSKLQDDMTRVRRKSGQLERRIAGLRKVTSGSVKKTIARSTSAAVRAVATAPGKALPYVGTFVVVGAVAWDIKDYCNTIRDMKAIQREIDLSESHSEEEPKFCGMDRNKILNRIKMAPRDAWKRSREFLTDLSPITPEIETMLNAELDRWWNKIEPNRWWKQLQSVVE